jgi:MFS family permease
MFVNTLLAVLAAPLVGRLIDRLGERKILSAAYAMLIFIFWGYSFIQNKWVLYALYCVDRLLFLASVSLSTYLNRIARTADLRPTISLGVTLNHVAAVTLPLVGGFLWDRFGYALIFQIGSVVAAIVLIIAQFIEPATTKPPRRDAEDPFRTAQVDDHPR